MWGISCLVSWNYSSLTETSNSSVSNNRGGVHCVNHGAGDHRGGVDSVDNRAGNHRGGVIGGGHNHGGGLVSRGGMDSLRVLGLAIIGHISHVSVIAIGAVVDVLDPAVGEVDRVGSIPEAGSIVGLGLLEGSARELVSHTVLVGVGGDLAEIVEPDSVGHRVGDGVHDRPGHGHGSSMHHRAGHSHGSSNSHTMAN